MFGLLVKVVGSSAVDPGSIPGTSQLRQKCVVGQAQLRQKCVVGQEIANSANSLIFKNLKF